MADKMMYRPKAVLGCQTNFSFLSGASHPEELVAHAHHLGWQAVGIADRFSCGGLVRAHMAIKDIAAQNNPDQKPVPSLSLDKLICGVGVSLHNGGDILCYSRTLDGYHSLCQWLSAAMMRSGHNNRALPDMHISDLRRLSSDVIVITLPPVLADTDYREQARTIRLFAPGDVYVGGYLMRDGCDEERLYRLSQEAAADNLGFVALGHVLYHRPDRRPLADVLSCIRHKTSLPEAGQLLSRNAERHLLAPDEMARRWQGFEQALQTADEIAASCQFSLDDLRYDYPAHEGRSGRSAMDELTWQAREGSRKRYPDGVPDKVNAYLDKELALVRKMGYAPFFLTVFDIVRFARSRNILCQGRGSAANSAICYCLFITSVDPDRSEPLFERFVSEARNEPPDIDVDFEHNRREEVIQYIYHRYGRHRAGLASSVITYKGRSAFVEVAKAFGLSRDVQRALSGQVWGRKNSGLNSESLRAVGLDVQDPTLQMVVRLARQIQGFPRHLSQHVGGFVIVQDRLDKLCVVRPAAMQGRSIIEWDKDDLDALGLLKIDVLALGMLSCLAGAFALMQRHYHMTLTLATIPPEDKRTYDMLCRGESVGVFQVESRAQMAMLPRLQPRCFHDLIVQVAIVRPGPIQGDMVHPYLRRRAGLEYVDYPSDELRSVLDRTLGVPLFQEQAMKIAIVGAGFSGAEADRLRRAMATFRKNGDIHTFFDKMVNGMIERGYDAEFAQRCFKQIEGFGTYGFPESHAASFALLVYASAWLKCHYPEVFTCALLNAQPMGFYSPAQLIADAQRSGVEVRPVDINYSAWDSTLELVPQARHALRLGLRLVKGLNAVEAARITACRSEGYQSVEDIITRSDISAKTIELIAAADGLRSLGLNARQGFWQARKQGRLQMNKLPLFAQADNRTKIIKQDDDSYLKLPPSLFGEQIAQDYTATGLSLKGHPVDSLKAWFEKDRWQGCSAIDEAPNGRRLRLIGLVTMRQRPGTAKGTVFVTIEDSLLSVNVIVWPHIVERDRTALLGAHLMGVYGRLQRQGPITHFIAESVHNCDSYLGFLHASDQQAPRLKSRDFH